MKYRVIQWSTGNVGRRALRAIIEHPEMELVGVYAHGKDKVGKDAAELCGLTEETGVIATNDLGALLSLKADCMNYNALIPDIDVIERFLESGVNVVGTAGFILGKYLAEGARERLDAAGKRGGASLYGSGFNPGLSNIMALVGTSLCDHVYSVSVTESVDVSDYASPETWYKSGWGKPLGEQSRQSFDINAVLKDAADMTAEALGIEVEDHRVDLEYAVTREDIDLPAGRFPKNTVAGQKMTYHCIARGRSVVQQNVVYKVRGSLEPDWPLEHGYVMDIEGEPSLKIRLQLRRPGVDGVNREKTYMDSGMVSVAMAAVNAIPIVCRAEPGVRRADELPMVCARGLLF